MGWRIAFLLLVILCFVVELGAEEAAPIEGHGGVVEGRLLLDNGSYATFQMSGQGTAIVWDEAERCGAIFLPVRKSDGTLAVRREWFCSPPEGGGTSGDTVMVSRNVPRVSFRHLASDSAKSAEYAWPEEPEDSLCCVRCWGTSICGGTVSTDCGSCPVMDHQQWQ